LIGSLLVLAWIVVNDSSHEAASERLSLRGRTRCSHATAQGW
jgi:hypothetical protein